MASADNITAALGAMHGASLESLRDSFQGAPDAVLGLSDWLTHAVRWELERRVGLDYPLRGLCATIDDGEIHLALGALHMLARVFRLQAAFGGTEVADFFEVAAATLHQEAGIPNPLQ